MAAGDITLKSEFKAGTVVGAYPAAQLSTHDGGPSGAPIGSPAATATVASDGTAAFTGLDVTKRYFVAPIPQSAVQTLTIDATSGNFRLRYGSDTVPPQKFNVTAANLKTALEALPAIGSGQIASITGGPGDSGGTTPYVITFGGTLASVAVLTLEVLSGAAPNASTALVNLTGGGATGTLAVTTAGHLGGEQYVAVTPNQA